MKRFHARHRDVTAVVKDVVGTNFFSRFWLHRRALKLPATTAATRHD